MFHSTCALLRHLVSGNLPRILRDSLLHIPARSLQISPHVNAHKHAKTEIARIQGGSRNVS